MVLSGIPRVSEPKCKDKVKTSVSREAALCASPLHRSKRRSTDWSNEFSPRLTGYACASRMCTSLSALLGEEISQLRAPPPIKNRWRPMTDGRVASEPMTALRSYRPHHASPDCCSSVCVTVRALTPAPPHLNLVDRNVMSVSDRAAKKVLRLS